jgi:membrane protein DedA with SNARE-associated domain
MKNWIKTIYSIFLSLAILSYLPFLFILGLRIQDDKGQLYFLCSLPAIIFGFAWLLKWKKEKNNKKSKN